MSLFRWRCNCIRKHPRGRSWSSGVRVQLSVWGACACGLSVRRTWGKPMGTCQQNADVHATGVEACSIICFEILVCLWQCVTARSLKYYSVAPRCVQGKLPITLYPHSFATEANYSSYDMSAPPGRTYRYYTGKPIYPFGVSSSRRLFETSLAGGELSGLVCAEC